MLFPVSGQEVDGLHLATHKVGEGLSVCVSVCVWWRIKQGYVTGREPGLPSAECSVCVCVCVEWPRLEQSHFTTWGGWQRVLCRAVYRSVRVLCVRMCVRECVSLFLSYLPIAEPVEALAGNSIPHTWVTTYNPSLRRQSRFEAAQAAGLGVCVCVSVRTSFSQSSNTHTHLCGHDLHHNQRVQVP